MDLAAVPKTHNMHFEHLKDEQSNDFNLSSQSETDMRTTTHKTLFYPSQFPVSSVKKCLPRIMVVNYATCQLSLACVSTVEPLLSG